MSEHVSEQPKKSGVSVGKVILRILIWSPVLLLLLELRAQMGHTAAVNKLVDLSGEEGDQDIIFADFEAALTWNPSVEVSARGSIADVHYYSWGSIFRKADRTLSVVVSREETPTVLRYFNGTDDPLAPIVPKGFVPATNELPSTASPGG